MREECIGKRKRKRDAFVRRTFILMKISQQIVCLLSFLTGFGILFLWILVWFGIFPIEDKIPGFRNYFISFQLADMWLVVNAILTGTFILLKNPKMILSGVSLGSSMVFFGLYSFLYDLNTKLLFDFSSGELFGKLITLYNVIGGMFFIVYFSKTKIT